MASEHLDGVSQEPQQDEKAKVPSLRITATEQFPRMVAAIRTRPQGFPLPRGMVGIHTPHGGWGGDGAGAQETELNAHDDAMSSSEPVEK
jgi:hypothetical protein